MLRNETIENIFFYNLLRESIENKLKLSRLVFTIKCELSDYYIDIFWCVYMCMIGWLIVGVLTLV